MGYDFSIFATYAAMLLNGNIVTNKLSIGEQTPKTGEDYPGAPPAGGLNTHGGGPEGKPIPSLSGHSARF